MASSGDKKIFEECYDWLLSIPEKSDTVETETDPVLKTLSENLIATCRILISRKEDSWYLMTPSQKELFNKFFPNLIQG